LSRTCQWTEISRFIVIDGSSLNGSRLQPDNQLLLVIMSAKTTDLAPMSAQITPEADIEEKAGSLPNDVPTFPNIHAENQPSMELTEVKAEPGPPEEHKKSWFSHFRAVKAAEDYDDHSNVPHLSYLELFKISLSFGARAFGGPVTQIAMMKEELVVDQKWISIDRFNRVYAVYQILPGPEATELACYFGYIARGRIGALIGGIGFLLPGSLLMLLWSYLYVTYGLDNRQTQAAFSCIRNTIAASIFRSTYKLADAALNDIEKGTKKKTFNWHRAYLCLFGFLTAVIGLNFFITLAVCGIMNVFFHSTLPHSDYIAYLIGAATIGFFVLYVALNGVPSPNLIGGDLSAGGDGTDYSALFVLGLIAGLVTFGGAYTTLPFIYTVAVTNGKWLTDTEFLDAVALVNVSPTPLVSFVTLVGWIGNGIGGAILMLIGIFLPAMSFTLIGHEYFEKMVDNPYLQPFLDGVSSAVIGLLVQTAFQFLHDVIKIPIDAVVFSLTFWALFHFTHIYTQPLIIIAAAIAGQVLY
jgi:putative chromate ion transporter